MLFTEAEPIWEAFWVLSSARQIAVGMGGVVEQPIAYSEIAAYAADRGWKASGLWSVVLPTVQAMDRAYRGAMAAKRAAEAPPPSTAAGKGGRA